MDSNQPHSPSMPTDTWEDAEMRNRASVSLCIKWAWPCTSSNFLYLYALSWHISLLTQTCTRRDNCTVHTATQKTVTLDGRVWEGGLEKLQRGPLPGPEGRTTVSAWALGPWKTLRGADHWACGHVPPGCWEERPLPAHVQLLSDKLIWASHPPKGTAWNNLGIKALYTSKPAHGSFRNARLPQAGETNPQEQFIKGVEGLQGLGAQKSSNNQLLVVRAPAIVWGLTREGTKHSGPFSVTVWL